MSDIGMPLATVQVDDKPCTYCLECTSVCPSGALTYDKCFEHDPDECMNCEVCMDVCEVELCWRIVESLCKEEVGHNKIMK